MATYGYLLVLLLAVANGCSPGQERYTINVYTGDVSSAGTDADVYITLIGSTYTSQPFYLDNPHVDDFERNTHSQFVVCAAKLGDIKNIYIRHDNSRKHPGWFLDHVRINTNGGRHYSFWCNCWLARDEGDHRISRFL